jgi:hypothetical protein
MKFTSFFRRKSSNEIKYVLDNAVRKEIDAYIRYTFNTNYVVLESTGRLEKFIDDSEDFYNEAFLILKDQQYKTSMRLDDEDITVDCVSQAFSVVFKDISKKMELDSNQ